MTKIYFYCFLYGISFKIRERALEYFFSWVYKGYHLLYKQHKEPWGITREELLKYPRSSLGYALGCFLQRNRIELLPRFEEHDVYHVISQYATNIIGEIQMQFFLSGSGKKTFTVFLVKLLGKITFPEFQNLFNKAYQEGQKTIPFWKWDFEYLLEEPHSLIMQLIFQEKEKSLEVPLFI